MPRIYRKLNPKKILILLFASLVLSSAFHFFMLSAIPVHADDVSDLQSKIDERNKNIAELEKEIADYKSLADKTSAQAKDLKGAISALQATQKKLDTDITLTQNKISLTTLTISKLDDQINQKQASVDQSKVGIAETLRLQAQEDNISIIQNFLQSKNLSEVWRRIQSIINFQDTLSAHVAELLQVKTSLAADKDANIKTKTDLTIFENQLNDQEKIVLQNKQEKDKLLTDTKNQQAEYAKLLADKTAKKAAFEKELFDYEAKLKYTLDPKSIPRSGSAVFSWPTDDVYITQFFGKTVASARLYVSGSHNGVDFKALMGTPVHAVLGGTVIGTGDTDIACPRASWGRWVLIKHPNGLASLYGHLSVIKVNEGQSMNTGDIIGYSGNTGYSTGPHLHISVFVSDAVQVLDRPSLACGGKVYHMPISPLNGYLDPMAYFPPYNK